MESTFILALSLLPGIGRKTIRKILKNIPSGIAGADQLYKTLRGKYTESTITISIKKAEQIILQSHRLGINVISPFDNNYPNQLMTINDPPVLLFCAGDICLLNNSKRVAIIGTRIPSGSGIQEGRFITQWLVEQNFTIVSGLAVGIDTIAHETALDNDGKTIAILPCPINNIYPHKNKLLANRIIENNGLIVSEYPIFTKIKKNFFIERDRIQSAISHSVVIIETEISGGAMYTANFCLEQKRVLCCVKYPVNIKQNSGNSFLIQSGKAFSVNRNNLSDFENLLSRTR